MCRMIWPRDYREGAVNHILSVLEDDEARLQQTFACAVGLADRERARLTLVKTTDPGWLMRWFAPTAIQSMMVPQCCLEFEEMAGHRLAAAVEFVPAQIPVTTAVLSRNTSRGLHQLLRSGRYDVLVVSDVLLHRCPRLARELVAREIAVVSVPLATDRGLRADPLAAAVEH
jgi:hypothetical protein